MPIYEYSCPKCGEFEVSQRITEDALKKCPTCKSKVRKLISNTSFQLKGSGWYVTDYAKKSGGGAKDASASGGESAKSSSDGESKSKDKSESKSEPAKATKKDTAAKAA